MPLSRAAFRSDLARRVGALAMTAVEEDDAVWLLRVASWSNSLARVGVSVPLFAVHDLGLLLAGRAKQPRVPAVLAPAAGPEAALDAKAAAEYVTLLAEVEETELVARARSRSLPDGLVSVLLLRLLSPVADRWSGRAGYAAGEPLPLDPTLFADVRPQLPALFAGWDRTAERSFLHAVADARLPLLTSVERVDLDTLKVLGLFGEGSDAAGASGGLADVLDLLQVMQRPDVGEVVRFSLDLLPSVLETKRAAGLQTFGGDGYAGVVPTGHLDHLLLSELAHDDDVFEQRTLENELLYYARTRDHSDERRLHYIVLDASASMRGVRQVFARGLALALVKKLSLAGEEVWVRFFDSRLHEILRVPPSKRGAIDVPYLLCFRSERGRNYRRVFRQLALDLEQTVRAGRRQAIVFIVTHAECHIPIEIVERLRRVAYLYGVLILPSSGGVTLDYLDLLHKVQVVDQAALDGRARRAERALEIVDDAGRVPVVHVQDER